MLSTAQRAKLDGWASEFEEEFGSFDPDLFAFELYRLGRIDETQYRIALRASDVPEVTPVLSMNTVPPDVEVEGPYVIIGEVGRGAMGVVHVAKDRLLRRKVAYKRIVAGEGFEGSRVRRFVAEAQITAQLEHPNIVPVYTVHAPDARHLAYAMKLVEGRTLAEVVSGARERAPGRPPSEEAHRRAERLEHFLHVCDAMAYAHSRGVVHRDLKPSNIMIGAYHEVYVMDWGIARLVQARDPDLALPSPEPSSPEDPSLTQDGQALGSPRYMAPEQARGDLEAIGPATDQYALGLILQELVTLQAAVRTSEPGVAIYRAMRAKRSAFTHVDPRVKVPPELAAIVARATAAEPSERYPGVAALADDVRAFLRGEEVSALPDTAFRRLGRWLAQNRELALAGVFGTVTLAALLVMASLILGLVQSSSLHAHERMLTGAHASAADAASAVEGELLRYGRLLEGVSAATTMVLTHSEPVDAPLYLGVDFADPARAPTDLGAPPSHLSLDHPALWVPPTLDPTAQRDTLGRLVRLREALLRTLIRSAPVDSTGLPDADQQRLIRDRGVPLDAIRIALANGPYLVYPGRQLVATDDPRINSWYLDAAGRRFLHWSRPERDAAGHVRVTCSRSIYGEDTRSFIGVAAMDVLLGEPIRALLAPDEPGLREAYLLDGDARVLARTGGDADLSEFPYADVRAVLDPDESRYVERTGEDGAAELVVVTPLPEIGWFHIVRLAM